MKYLIVGDSHVWDLQKYLKTLDTNASSYIVSRGQQSAEIIITYRAELQHIINYDPEVCVLHMGHNDMATHTFLNPTPPHPLAVTAQLIGFASEVKINFPLSKFLLSSTLPRHHTHASNLSLPKVLVYNKSCKWLGQGLRHDAAPHKIQVGLNNIFWSKISKAIEAPEYYLLDGLHLNPAGKQALTRSWLVDLRIIAAYSSIPTPN